MFENLSLALQGVWNHKLRSFLTMLGIIIGIASIITIVATIKGTNEQIKENLVGAGTNAVVVSLYQNDSQYYMEYQTPPEGITTVSEDTRQELEELANVKAVSLYCSRDYVDGAYYKNSGFNGSLCGVDSHYFDVYSYKIVRGRDFVAEDFSSCRKVVILDSDAKTTIFAGEDPLGKTIELMGESYTVVGVAERGSSTIAANIETISDYYLYNSSSGGTLFIPLTTWPILYRFDEPQTVALKAASTDDMTAIGQKAAEMLTERQLAAVDPSQGFSYRSGDLSEQAEKMQSLATSSNRQLLWIASISLLVGGIGVMNIMLVTVTERTREIGLKKAIGARRRRILWQFLTEAAVLTSLGGVLGVAAGIVMSRMISSVMGTPTMISAPAAAIAVVFSMVIGIVFGLLPAVKAANLNPIDALRRE